MDDSAEAPESDLHRRPVLALDPGFHTGQINRADIDAEGRVAVTGSHDRTVRVWDVESGKCKRTIRLPQGAGDLGKVYAVALSPDGRLVAAGGYTTAGPPGHIYVFSAVSGALKHRIAGLADVVLHLAFSPDGRRLAATLGNGAGLRLFAADGGWAEMAGDAEYGGSSYGAACASDGRLATTCEDGDLRLYDPDGELLKRVPSEGLDPCGLAFDPTGARLAVGFSDSTAVRLFDGQSLASSASTSTSGLDNGDLSTVTWSNDGATLFAAGRFNLEGSSLVIAWEMDRGATRGTLVAGSNTVMSLRALPDGDLLVAATDPWLGRLGVDGTLRWSESPRHKIDPRGQRHNLGLSNDGMMVDFGIEEWGNTRVRFDLRAMGPDPPDDGRTRPPVQQGMAITDWENTRRPTLAGVPLPLKLHEISRSLAEHPDGARFVLGTEWSLRAFTEDGRELWPPAPAPGIVWAVNISGDGRLVLAACGDGTLRWHDMESGAELLALFPLPDRENWVAWTPEGIYAATSGARGILRWHVNRGWDRAAEAIPVDEIPETHRPEVIRHVLPQMGTAGAVRRATGSDVAPGARLHVLAIGVSRHGEAAPHLDLEFAHRDALDVANALRRSQSSLYAEVVARELVDEDATRTAIFDALGEMRAGMERGGGSDVGVVLYCGHGEMVDGDRFYLLPHGVDVTSPAAIKGTGLPATDFHEEIAAIAQHGRILVFLDACRAAGAANPLDRSLRAMLNATNVTVFSSSSKGQLSYEHAEWENGAFTEALLEALQKADHDHDGLISASDLASYLDRRVPELAHGKGVVQRPDLATGSPRRILAAVPVG